MTVPMTVYGIPMTVSGYVSYSAGISNELIDSNDT